MRVPPGCSFPVFVRWPAVSDSGGNCTAEIRGCEERKGAAMEREEVMLDCNQLAEEHGEVVGEGVSECVSEWVAGWVSVWVGG